MPKPICLWSGPRNVSTALMYSFAQHSEVRVVDEPLYGHYLRVSGADHPGRDDVIAGMNLDGNAVITELLERAAKHPATRLFLKNMAHHLIALDVDFLNHVRNVFLVRDPREILPSLVVQLPHATLTDTGLQRQWQLYGDLVATGQQPVILDSRELLLDPEGVLQRLCELIDLPFQSAMLHWPAAPLAEDGIWAPHWYHAVHLSTGFAAYEPKNEFPPELEPLLAECKPWYDKLFAYALRAHRAGA
ncbi:MAG: sulfotransferase family protein [Proteobacteria bacterium]|nr:sulfotransferase family protein [Pseudomonadota bacterium]